MVTRIAASGSGMPEGLTQYVSESLLTEACYDFAMRERKRESSELIKYHALVKSIKPLDQRKDCQGQRHFCVV